MPRYSPHLESTLSGWKHNQKLIAHAEPGTTSVTFRPSLYHKNLGLGGRDLGLGFSYAPQNNFDLRAANYQMNFLVSK